jgi:DNA-binding beta-propeller fold protein YncE
MVNLLQSGEATEQGMGEFDGPEGLAVDLDGYVYVTDQEMILSRNFCLVDNRLTKQI